MIDGGVDASGNGLDLVNADIVRSRSYRWTPGTEIDLPYPLYGATDKRSRLWWVDFTVTQHNDELWRAAGPLIYSYARIRKDGTLGATATGQLWGSGITLVTGFNEAVHALLAELNAVPNAQVQ